LEALLVDTMGVSGRVLQEALRCLDTDKQSQLQEDIVKHVGDTKKRNQVLDRLQLELRELGRATREAIEGVCLSVCLCGVVLLCGASSVCGCAVAGVAPPQQPPPPSPSIT
jgi:hypothetical protein